MTYITVVDFKGEVYMLRPIGARLNEKNGRPYYYYAAMCFIPPWMRTNGANYDTVWTEIFTEWWDYDQET